MENVKQTALVTGASGGIGREFARQLAALKYDVVLVSRNKEKLEELKEALEGLNQVTCYVIPCDLSAPGGAQALYNEYQKSGIGPLTILVNNAGTGASGESIHQPLHETEALLNLNITALTELCILFGKDMAERKQGYILNVGSIAARNAIPYFASYSASKWYVLGYSISLARELKPRGVTVTCLLPGFVRTEFDANSQITSEKYKQMSHKSGMLPGKVAKIGIRAMFRKSIVTTAGLQNKISGFFSGLIPRTFSSLVMKNYLDKLLK